MRGLLVSLLLAACAQPDAATIQARDRLHALEARARDLFAERAKLWDEMVAAVRQRMPAWTESMRARWGKNEDLLAAVGEEIIEASQADDKGVPIDLWKEFVDLRREVVDLDRRIRESPRRVVWGISEPIGDFRLPRSELLHVGDQLARVYGR